MKDLTLTTFKMEVENSELPCVIKFYKDTCWMCRDLEHPYVQLEDEFEGQYNFFVIDDEAEEDLGTLFEIDGVPSIYVYSKDTGMVEIPFPAGDGYTYDYLHDFLDEHDYL